MTDIPPSGTSPGGISVPVTADLGPFRQSLAQGKAEAQQFDASVTQALNNPAKAAEALTGSQQRLIDALLKTNATAKEAAAVFGKSADGIKALTAYNEALAAAQKAAAAAAAASSAANVENAASAAAATAAVGGLHMQLGLVTRELTSLGSEAARGNFNRMGSSVLLLARGMGFLAPEVIGTTAAVVGITAAIAAAVVATVQWEESQKKLQANLMGVGARSGQSPGSINAAGDMAMRVSNQSVQEATSAAKAFADAGVTDQNMITALAGSITIYSQLTGEKAAPATKQLAAAMEDPAKGAEELHRQIGILTQTQVEHIQSLAQMGEKEQAVAELTRAFTARMGEAQAGGVGLRGSIDNLKVGFTFLWQEVGKTVDQLKLFYSYSQGTNTPANQAKIEAQLASARSAAQRQAIFGAEESVGAADAQDTPEARDAKRKQDLEGQDARLRQSMMGAQRLGDTSAYAKDASALKDVVSALRTYVPEAQKAHEISVLDAQIAATKDQHLKAQLTTQRELLQLGGEVMDPGERQQRAADAGAIAGARGPKGPKDRSQSASALRDQETAGLLAISAAYLQSDSAALRAEASAKTYDDALKEHASVAERARMIQSELNNELAKAGESAAKEVAQARAQTEAERAANDAVAAGRMSRVQAEEQLKEQEKLRPILAAYDVADAQTKAALKPVVDALTASYRALNAEQLRGKLGDMAQTDKDETAVLQLRLSLVNATKQAQDQAVARATASQQVSKAGGDPTQGAGLGVVNAAGDKANAQAALQGAEAMRSMTLQVEAETQAFQKQQATLGMTLQQADRYTEMEKLLAEAKKDGITVDAQELQRLQQLASGYAQAAQSARTLSEAQKAAMTASTALSDSFEKSIEGMVFDGKSLTSTAHDLAKSLGKEGLEAVLTGQGPFAGMLGTAQSSVVGGANGGILSQLFGSVMGVPGAGAGGMLGGKGPSGTAMDPIYTAPSAVGALMANPLAGVAGMDGSPLNTALPNASYGASGMIGAGGGLIGQLGGLLSSGVKAGGSMLSGLGSMLAGVLHDGSSYVGTPARQISVPSSLFVGAPRLHSGLAPDEYPAILQTGEAVKPRGGSVPGQRSTTVHMHIHGVQDTGGFNRSTHQVARRMKQAVG